MNKTQELIMALENLRIIWPNDDVMAIEHSDDSGRKFNVTWKGKEPILIDLTDLWTKYPNKFGDGM